MSHNPLCSVQLLPQTLTYYHQLLQMTIRGLIDLTILWGVFRLIIHQTKNKLSINSGKKYLSQARSMEENMSQCKGRTIFQSGSIIRGKRPTAAQPHPHRTFCKLIIFYAVQVKNISLQKYIKIYQIYNLLLYSITGRLREGTADYSSFNCFRTLLLYQHIH